MISLLLPPALAGLIAAAALIATTLAGFLAFLPFILFKLLVPHRGFRRACTNVLFTIVRQWATANHLLYRLLYPLQWEVEINGRLDPTRSYLLLSNHQSWIDILLLCDQFHHRAPPLCFFLKRELLWVPAIGIACWAMDFPFMRRNPAQRHEDLEATRRACEKFREQPVTVVNFAEGTRFSEAKRIARQSPFRHLLRPKAAGLAYTFNAMGDQFGGVIDVTIGYRPSRYPILWSFLIGEQTHLMISIDVHPLPQELLAGDYEGDPAYRERVRFWINGLWQRKDARLDRWLSRPTPVARPHTI
jgi:1-acyl-sn-glycerol-3-phosphate acyltransferase